MWKTLVCLDGQQSIFEAKNFDSQIMGELGWLALTGITLFSEIAAKMVVVGSREAGTSIVCACFMGGSRAVILAAEW